MQPPPASPILAGPPASRPASPPPSLGADDTATTTPAPEVSTSIPSVAPTPAPAPARPPPSPKGLGELDTNVNQSTTTTTINTADQATITLNDTDVVATGRATAAGHLLQDQAVDDAIHPEGSRRADIGRAAVGVPSVRAPTPTLMDGAGALSGSAPLFGGGRVRGQGIGQGLSSFMSLFVRRPLPTPLPASTVRVALPVLASLGFVINAEEEDVVLLGPAVLRRLDPASGGWGEDSSEASS